jgi:hypothetical protein
MGSKNTRKERKSFPGPVGEGHNLGREVVRGGHHCLYQPWPDDAIRVIYSQDIPKFVWRF